jgi:4-amino-4-deoxy-L-arabinose transferase-like glycosyltransferase
VTRSAGLAGVIAVVYGLGLAWSLPSTALTDDDAFYLPAGAAYAEWWGRALTGDGWTRADIDRAFVLNHEHPPVAKLGLGIAGWVFRGWGPVDGPRMATVLASTLVAWLMVVLSILQLGRWRGLWMGGLAVLLLLLLPRFHFHSRVATLDVPVAAAYLLAATLALAGERHRWAAWMAGPAFGVAAATKLNGPFLIVPMAVFWWLTRRRRPGPFEPRPAPGRVLSLPPLPETALSMLVLGPLTFFALWPWMWFDTVDRVVEYVSFHLHHYPIYFLYFGRVYAEPFAPWHAPLVMTVFTTSSVGLLLGVVGVGVAGRFAVLRILRRDDGHDPDRQAGDLALFLALHAVCTIGVVMFSGGPKYGGVKLFLPFFPFWCLLGGWGGLWLVERGRSRGWMTACLGVGLFGASLWSRSFDEYALSAYGAAAGGLRGAATWGMERQYYDLLTVDQTRWLSERAPPNTRVHFLPNHKEYVKTFAWAHRQGRLRSDVRVAPDLARADWVVLTHERRWARYDRDLESMRSRRPVFTRFVDGVPLWTVFTNR